MKKSRKIIRYSTQYSKKARAKRAVLRVLSAILLIAVLTSAGFIVTGLIVDHKFPWQKGESSQSASQLSDSSDSSEQSDSILDNSSDTSSDASVSSDSSDRSESDTSTPISDVMQKGIVMPLETLLSDAKRSAFLADAAQKEYKTVIIDVKNTDGKVLYQSELALPQKTGAIAQDAYDLKAIVEEIQQAGFTVTARMSALQDPISAHADYNTSYLYADTNYTWLDNSASLGGKAWLNPYLTATQEYMTGLVEELTDAGCDAVLVQKMRFPTAYTSKLNQGSTTVARQDMLADLAKQMQDAADGKPVIFCFDAEAYFNKNVTQYDGTPGGISGLRYVCPEIDLNSFSDIAEYDAALEDISFDALTEENLKLILSEVKAQHPQAQIIPLADSSLDGLTDCLKELGISAYLTE